MDALSNQGFESENGTQTYEGLDNIELDNHELWNESNSTPWQLEEDERDQLRGNDVSVQFWLQNQGNSQPAKGTFVNYQSLPQRKRENSNLIVHVENVLGTSGKQSSAQAARTCDPTALRARNPTASNIITSTDERGLEKPRFTVQYLKPSSTTTDRKTRYPANGHHEEGRPPSTWISQDRSTTLTTPLGPQSRGSLKQSVEPSFQQTARSVAATNISSSSKKSLKRQNSRSTDDDSSRKHAFTKRNRSAIKDHSWRRTSPTSSGSVQTDLAIRVSHNDFVDRCETCPFWLHDPNQFSTNERQACYGRKEEVSHIVTHVLDHHGLIRGKDPKQPSRSYLASCQTHDPSIKKGNCEKCKSLHNWKDEDFADSEHHGIALCLRCWCRFDKKGMQTHVAEPLCDYNSEQLKQKKTKPPGEPPKNLAPRKSISRPASSRSYGSDSRQQASNKQAQRPKQERPSRNLRPTSSHFSYGQRKQQAPRAPSIPASTQDQPVTRRHAPTSHQPYRPYNQQAVMGNQPIWQQPNTHQPYRNHGNQDQFNRPAHFGSMINKGSSSVNNFQQQGHLQTQSMSLPPGQYQNWEQPAQIPQTSFQPYSQNFDQTRQQRQSHGNATFAQALQHGLASPGLFQQSSDQFSPANTNPVTFDTNPRIFQACFDAANMPQPQHQPEPEPQRQTISMSDLDASISQCGGMSQMQSSPSRVASTAGESMYLLKSPNVEEPPWLAPDWSDDWLNLNTTGAHPVLQEEEPVGGSRPLPLMEQHQDVKPDGRISAMQQAHIEKESGYYSTVNDAEFANNMFNDSFIG
ncbi:hypothetical protein ACHAP5_001442 [Fusarium lateritium]